MMKIRIIELLNLIANKEEIPRHIKYECYQYDWNDNANNYICEDADGERLSMFDDGYICILCNSLNDEVEILEDSLEDNIEEIEELPTELKYGSAINGNPEYDVTQKEIVDKINELVRYVNQIRKDKE